jgi:hypothetical protein
MGHDWLETYRIMNTFKCPHCNKAIHPSLISGHFAATGGKALLKKKGKEYFRKIGKKGGEN